MKLKNKEILALVNAGVLAITSHSVAIADNYKVYSFRKALKNAYQEYAQKEEDLLKECGIENPQEFNSKLQALSLAKEPTQEEQAELATMKELVANYNKMRFELENDDVEVACNKTISYESWVALQKENSEKEINGIKADILSGNVEEILEGKFWLAPAEEE